MRKSTHDMMIAGAVGLGALCCTGAAYAQDACLDARVTASDPGVFESFGFSVAVSGDTALIGADWDSELGTQAGAAYVFRPDRDKSGTWAEMQKLLGSDQVAGDQFAHSVATDGSVAMIGSLQHIHDGAPGTGAVYAFRFDSEASVWIEEQEVLTVTGAWADGFGEVVSLRDDLMLVGARFDDDNGGNAGAAFVFRFDPDTSQWVEEQKLLASDGAGGDFFGTSVAIFGDIAVIGANGYDGGCPDDPTSNSGAAYVFRFDPKTATWSEQQKLLASDAGAQDFFGESVAVFGDVALIGANDNGPGSAYVFQFDPKSSQWVEQQKLLASDGQGGDQFGRAVAIDGERALIGAWKHDDLGSSSGAAYVFGFDAESSTWIEQHKLLPQPNPWSNFFGYSVALDGETAVIGAHGEDQQRGAAYVFDVALNCTCPHDLDLDGSVGASDLLALLASWGPCKGCPADFDDNGSVGASDLLALLANWGVCP